MSEPTTKPVRDLVEDVLARGVPRTEHVIDEVFLAIEADRRLRAEYDGLCEQFELEVVNQMVGKWTKSILGWATLRQTFEPRNTLSKSYSVLVPSSRRLTSQERREQAASEVYAFFREYRAGLDRDVLVPAKAELEQHVYDGLPVEEAFFAVLRARGLSLDALQQEIARRARAGHDDPGASAASS